MNIQNVFFNIQHSFLRLCGTNGLHSLQYVWNHKIKMGEKSSSEFKFNYKDLGTKW